MTEKIVSLFPNQDIANALRLIADNIDAGQERFANITIIAEGYDQEMAVFQLGSKNDDYAVKDAVFNLTFGLGYLTNNTSTVRAEMVRHIPKPPKTHPWKRRKAVQRPKNGAHGNPETKLTQHTDLTQNTKQIESEARLNKQIDAHQNNVIFE